MSVGQKRMQVVTIANSLQQSLNGDYYVGQTPTLTINQSGYGALYNPSHSKSDLYVNVFTVTNFSNAPIVAQIWLGALPQHSGRTSKQIANTNRTLAHPPESPIQIKYNERAGAIKHGVHVFDRIIPPNTTIVAEEDGKYIIPPKQYFIITLKPLSKGPVSAALAYGWWTHHQSKNKGR